MFSAANSKIGQQSIFNRLCDILLKTDFNWLFLDCKDKLRVCLKMSISPHHFHLHSPRFVWRFFPLVGQLSSVSFKSNSKIQIQVFPSQWWQTKGSPYSYSITPPKKAKSCYCCFTPVVKQFYSILYGICKNSQIKQCNAKKGSGKIFFILSE